MTDIWRLDTTEMTLVELQAYKAELLRLEEQSRQRRARNIRLLIYAVVLVLLLTGLVMLPGSLRAQRGPVTLMPMSEYSDGEQEEGPGGAWASYVKRLNAHTFLLMFEGDADLTYDSYGDSDLYGDRYRRVIGEICQETEWMNRRGRSSVSFTDGTTGAVWYKRRPDVGAVDLMVEYKGNVYGYSWGSLKEFDEYQERMKR